MNIQFMNNISIRLLHSEIDIDLVNMFYNSHYNKQRTKNQFLWEFMNGPAGSSIYVLAFDNAKLIGTVCGVPFNIEDNTSIIKSIKVEDLLIDQNYRGQGIFQGMMKLLTETASNNGYQNMWAFTYATKSFQSVGFDIPYKVNLGFFNYNVSSLVSHLKITSKAPDWKLLIFSLLSRVTSIKGMLSKQSLRTYTVQERKTENLSALLRRTGLNFFSQTTSFLNWRVYNNPYLSTKRSFELLDANKILVGSIIVNYSQDAVAHWIQHVFDETLPTDLKKEFIKHVVTHLKKDCNLIRYWGFDFGEPQIADIKLMKQCGFLFTQRGIPFVWKDIHSAIDPKTLFISRMVSQGTV